tara:strand:- start:63116 stop:63970 length:855 start_codon:yes stop_codon:yes gene_type:complete
MNTSTDTATHKTLQDIERHGYAIIPNFLDEQQLKRVNTLFDALLGQHRGRNDFEGAQTERIYTLVARDRIFQDIAEDPRIMALCDALFLPQYLLTASQAIVIGPGETPQPWHTDDSFYPIPRPRPMISLSTIVAVEDFTARNGGTEVIPGSHLWSDEEVAGNYRQGDQESDPDFAQRVKDQSVAVTMAAGSCLVFAGTLLHRGGANNSQGTRRAFSNQYCEPWARPQENFFLGIPRDAAATMSAKLQSLLGYSIHPPFMGQVTAEHPQKSLTADYVPPAFRKSR